MKIKLLALTSCFLLVSSRSFTQELSLSWESKEKISEIKEVVLIDSAHILLKRIYMGNVYARYSYDIVEFKETNLGKLNTSQRILPYSTTDIMKHNFNFRIFNNHLYAINYYSKKGRDLFYLEKFDDQYTLAADTINLLPEGAQNGETLQSKSFYKVKNDYSLIWKSKKGKANEHFVHITMINNNSFKPIYSKRVDIPGEFDEVDLICNTILKDGSIVFACRPAKNPSVGSLNHTPIKGESHKITIFHVTATETNQFVLELKNELLVVSGCIIEQPTGLLIEFIAKIDPDDNAPFLVSVECTVDELQAEVISVNSLSEEFTGLQTSYTRNAYSMNYHLLKDGSVVSIAQKEDFIIYKVTPDGEIQWKIVAPHRELSGKTELEEWNGGYFSFIDKEGNLVILFNENKMHYDEKGNFIPGMETSILQSKILSDRSITVMIIVDPSDGTVTRQRLPDMEPGELLYPNFTQKISESRYLMFKSSPTVESIGILNLE